MSGLLTSGINDSFVVLILASAVLYGTPLLFAARQQIVEFANTNRVPSFFDSRYFVEAGGLFSYGPDLSQLFTLSVGPVDRILRGANPADIPVQMPTHYELFINRKTASSLGVKILASFGMGGLTEANKPAQQRAYAECARNAPMMLGDYYPLTPYSLANDAWIGWQFDRPEQGDGMIQVFRRGDSIYRQADLKLRGLDAHKEYAINDMDSGTVSRRKGRELMGQGLLVEILKQPGSALLTYNVCQ